MGFPPLRRSPNGLPPKPESEAAVKTTVGILLPRGYLARRACFKNSPLFIRTPNKIGDTRQRRKTWVPACAGTTRVLSFPRKRESSRFAVLLGTLSVCSL